MGRAAEGERTVLRKPHSPSMLTGPLLTDYNFSKHLKGRKTNSLPMKEMRRKVSTSLSLSEPQNSVLTEQTEALPRWQKRVAPISTGQPCKPRYTRPRLAVKPQGPRCDNRPNARIHNTSANIV
uniref:Uncharacterized protein n=1 Tax=Trichuris muris TaxID=70415 RepID=A0A5S6QCV3_TRIMR